MSDLTTEDIIKATGGRVIYSNGNPGVFTGVSIDSRTIGEGELFVALKGQRFDGHNFLTNAMKKGSGAIVSDPPPAPVKGKTIIYVRNTLKALQDMAHYARMKSGVRVIGITGTNGKTTTKELIASILSVRYRVMKNSGNLNNHIGLPLSLTKIGNEYAFAVMEMGASIMGDIKQLCDIASPEYGVITNIGPAHLEGFGSIESVLKTKLELLDEVKTIVLNADDDFLMRGASSRIQDMETGTQKEIIKFGILGNADVRARDIVLEDRRSAFNLYLRDACSIRVALNVGGRFNIYNALAAASICDVLGVDPEDIKTGIESFVGVPMRLEFKELFGAVVISDIYNANPASMEEAIKELVRLRRDRAVAILGDMLELGAYAEEAHKKLGRWMSELPVDVFVAVGPMMTKAAEEFLSARMEGGPSERNGSPHVFTVSEPSEAGRILVGICKEGDTVLVKGSRGMHMEQALENRESERAGNAL